MSFILSRDITQTSSFLYVVGGIFKFKLTSNHAADFALQYILCMCRYTAWYLRALVSAATFALIGR